MRKTVDGRYHGMELPGFEKGFGGELVPGMKFKYEVALKDVQGFHIGYGPGTKIHTMNENYQDERGCLIVGPQRVYIQQ